MRAVVALMCLVTCLAACEGASPADPRSGGATTVTDQTSLAYAQAAPNLTSDELNQFNLGHSIFNQNWVTAPATTSDMDGLGPLYNQRSCSACHSHDGRSPPFSTTGALLGLLVRVSVDGNDPHGGPLGDDTYGLQIRPYGIGTIPGDATPSVTYTEQPGTYDDGTTYSLQMPTTTMTAWNYGTPSSIMTSVRTGSAVFGLGLLEAIPETDLLANVRTNDPDGVVGKANYVWDKANGVSALGRFGWKANQPSLAQQTASALQGDIGITSTLFPDEPCTAVQTACLNAPRGGQPDIADEPNLASLVAYMQTLAVPERRDLSDSHALHGEQLFADFGCASCHAPTMHTSDTATLDAVRAQTIHPYTDLLLHDLGPGLADGRPDYLATGSEWRTPPLWGIGLLQTVNGHQQLLHDGRARGLAEAILWHDGEGAAAKERFRKAAASDRTDLLTFLQSL